jgi:MATE family multidrug resistance protein
MLLTRPGLELLGQDAELAALAGRYNRYKLPVIPRFLVYTALRQYLQGRTIMRPATIVMWLGNAVHLPLSWVLIFGVGGSPALGIQGAALAESMTFLILVVGLVVWIRRHRLHAGAWQPWCRATFAPRGIQQTMRLGIPIGLQIASEAWAFSIAALMAGWLDPVAVGSHQIAINLVVLFFMLPLGVSQAASARIGNLIGAGDTGGMRQAIQASLFLGAAVAVLPAVGFTLLRAELPWLYSNEVGVRELAARLLPIAAAFQLFDAVQVVAGAILRGMGRPDGGALVSILGYYLLALPLGYVLGLVLGVGLVGVWLGLAVGLTSIAVTLSYLLYRAARRPVFALQLDIERANVPSSITSDVMPTAADGQLAA